MGSINRWDVRCSECGRFCVPYDKGTYYGSCNDLEPPDPLFFCKKCVEKKLEEPERVISRCWWIKPNYVRVAKSIVRHRRDNKEGFGK